MNLQINKFSSALTTLLVLFLTNIYPQNSGFYGVTSAGGSHNGGLIFKTDDNGNNFQIIHEAFSIEGDSPRPELCETSDGRIFGITSYGGRYNAGVIFEWDPVSNAYIKKFEFTGKETGFDPKSSLLLASNGKMYGTTSLGGLQDSGVLFEWDPLTNTYTKKYDFDGSNGSYPWSKLIQTKNGKLYGMTVGGGVYDCGVIYEWDPVKDTCIKKIDLNGTDRGRSPYDCSLMQASSGKLYGMTYFGGSMDLGMLFEWDAETNAFIKRADFEDSNGAFPRGSLIEASDGKLYGMVAYGGNYGKGVLFQWDPLINKFTKKYDFREGTNGFVPEGNLLQASDGKLYGIASGGGVYGYGVIFEWNLNNELYTKRFDFDGTGNGSPQGGSLLQAKNGKLYGAAVHGGIQNAGVIFELDLAANKLTGKLEFDQFQNGRSYSQPMVHIGNGIYYGISLQGGNYDQGVIFKFDSNTNAYTKKFDFGGKGNGISPCGPLVLAPNGKLYGTTNQGGPNEMGLIFEWDPVNDKFTRKFEFSEIDGAYPNSGLLASRNGKLYGLTIYGGKYGEGVLFEWDPALEIYKKEIDFFTYKTGGYPNGSLCEAKNGKLYGISYDMNDSLILFEWDTDLKSFSSKFKIPGSSGEISLGSVMQHSCNGKLYGAALQGGVTKMGAVFEYDLTSDTLSKLISFNGPDGSAPIGPLTEGPDGKLFGMTKQGGSNGQGVLFSWDPVQDTITRILDFDRDISGSYPLGALLAIRDYALTDTIYAEECEKYLSPSGKYTWTSTGLYTDLLADDAGCDSLVFVKLKINNSTGTLSQVLCNPMISPSGKYTWRESGTYHDTIPNSCGCDSIITIYLTIPILDTSILIDNNKLISNEVNADYQWINCDQGISITGETDSIFIARNDGNYAVIVSKNGCVDTSSCYHLTATGLIDNTFEKEIILFPNPHSGTFFVDMGKEYPNVEISITDASGSSIYYENLPSAQNMHFNLDTSPGIYWVTIVSGGERAIFKVIKK